MRILVKPESSCLLGLSLALYSALYTREFVTDAELLPIYEPVVESRCCETDICLLLI